MPRHASVSQLRSLLRDRDALRDRGWSDRAIRAGITDGTLHRLRRGIFMDAGEWSQLWPESRHLAEVVAAASVMSSPHAAMARESAGVLWGLPLYRMQPSTVQVVVDATVRINSGVRVTRHVARLPDADVTTRHGIVCTTLDRTVFDIARTATPEAAIACADAALGIIAVRKRVQDEHEAELWRERMLGRIDSAGGARGVSQARRIVEFADGRAELPGESVSRLQLARLGFQRTRTQVPVPAPGGGTYWIDFGLEDADAFGEFDGTDKYLDEAMRSGKTVEEIVLAEKRREDWIRGTTGRRVVRWSSEHIGSPEALAARLRAFSISPLPS